MLICDALPKIISEQANRPAYGYGVPTNERYVSAPAVVIDCDRPQKIELTEMRFHWMLQAIRYRLTSMPVDARRSAVRRHDSC
jgi:hypothetical protein